MAEEDGQVRIKVNLETSEIDKDIQKLQDKLAKQNETLARQSIIVEKLTTRYADLYEKAKQTATPNIESEKILVEINKLEGKYKELQNLYNQAKLEPEIDQNKINEILSNLEIVDNKLIELRRKHQETQFSPDMQNKLKLLGQQIDAAVQKEDRLKNEVKATETEINKLSNKRIDGLKDSVDKVKNSFKSLANKLKEIQNNIINYAKNGVSNALSNVGNTISSLGKRILNLGASAFVFNVISSGFHKMANGIKNVIAHDNQLNNSLAQVKANLATAFYPIYQAVLPAIQSLGRALSWITGQIASFIAMVTGTSITINQQGAKNIMAGTNALNKQAKGYDKVGKSVKKAKKELASFDKIEVLQSKHNKGITPDNSGLGGGSSGIIGFDQQIKSLNSDPLDNIINKFKELGSLFQKGFDFGFIDKNLNEVWNNLQRIGQVAQNIFNDPNIADGFNRALDSIVYNLGVVAGSVASIGVTLGRLLTGGIAEYLEENQERIKSKLLRCFDITKELSNFIGEFARAFADIFEIFASPQAQKSLSNMLSAWLGLFSSFAINVYDVLVTMLKNALNPFIKYKDDIKKALGNALTSVEIFTEGVKNLFNKLGEKMDETTQKSIKPAIEKIGELWSDVVDDMIKKWDKYLNPTFNDIAETFKNMVDVDINPKLEELSKTFNDTVGDILELIDKLWDKSLKPFMEWLLANVFDKIKFRISDTSKLLIGLLSNALTTLDDLIQVVDRAIGLIEDLIEGDWTKVWENAKGILKGLVNFAIDQFNSLIIVINSIIDRIMSGINVAIRSLNRLSFDMPDWLGGGHFGLNIPEIPKGWGNIPKIPRLAKGAVLEGGHPFLAMLNEQPRGQTNIETPLSTMIEAFKQANRQSNPNIVVEASGDFAPFIRMLNFKLKEEDARVGQSFVMGDVWV